MLEYLINIECYKMQLNLKMRSVFQVFFNVKTLGKTTASFDIKPVYLRQRQTLGSTYQRKRRTTQQEFDTDNLMLG